MLSGTTPVSSASPARRGQHCSKAGLGDYPNSFDELIYEGKPNKCITRDNSVYRA